MMSPALIARPWDSSCSLVPIIFAMRLATSAAKRAGGESPRLRSTGGIQG